ncbi:MAG: anion permease [Verrucomicrobia bacterium]|nr:anion permease [Verrucomicrobiota bacterium]
MNPEQLQILAILAATVVMFLWGRWRHDMVALGALLACVFAGLVPRSEAFAGFGHPAVITVACVLVMSRSLQNSGAVDILTQRLLPSSAGPTLTIAALTGLGALLSAFMNNVGALALLMPVAIQVAAKQRLPPGQVLMPLAFGSILGGMTTLIGTPSNLIVSGFRAQTGAGTFAMFDFTPVGLAVAAGGVLFVALLGWRLVPARERAGVEGFDTGAYLTEARITEDSKAHGKSLADIGKVLEDADAQVVGLVRNEVRVTAPHAGRVMRAGDILVIEAEPKSLAAALSSLGLKLVEALPVKPQEKSPKVESVPAKDKPLDKGKGEKAVDVEEVVLMELAVRPDTYLVGRSATDLQLRTRFGINLLALSRQGRRSIRRLRSERIQAGDVLLLQGSPDAVVSFGNEFGCVPLAQRAIRLPNRRQAVLATLIMAAAVGGAAFGLLPAAISFAAGVLAAMALRVVSPRTVYDAVDWPVIVLLAALIPVAGAMASTGAADLVARFFLEHLARGHPIIGVALILVVTMTLSDFMNNAATAAVMCPIAISTAAQLDARPDSFLMAVAIGASCAFLTPIGHQNNTLILGPGGFRFGDFWKLGLPLEIVVIAISIPLLLFFWPL